MLCLDCLKYSKTLFRVALFLKPLTFAVHMDVKTMITTINLKSAIMTRIEIISIKKVTYSGMEIIPDSVA